jgi:hypothetical protein
MAHNRHMLAYACIQRGQSAKAIKAINEMAAAVPPEWVKENAAVIDGFTGMPLEVLVRFGKWDEVLAAPEPPDFLPIARAMRHCARGIAYAAKGKVANARKEQSAFASAKARVPEEAVFSNNKGHDLLAVAEQLLAGEILYREGKVEESVAALKDAIARCGMPSHRTGCVRCGIRSEQCSWPKDAAKKHPSFTWRTWGNIRAMAGRYTALRKAWSNAENHPTRQCSGSDFRKPGPRQTSNLPARACACRERSSPSMRVIARSALRAPWDWALSGTRRGGPFPPHSALAPGRET